MTTSKSQYLMEESMEKKLKVKILSSMMTPMKRIDLAKLWCRWNNKELTDDQFRRGFERLVGKRYLLSVWSEYKQ